MSNSRSLIKPYTSQFTFVSRCLDSGLIILAEWFVFVVNGHSVSSNHWLIAGVLASLVHQILAEFTQIYRPWRSESLWVDAKSVCLSWGLSFALVFVLGQYSPLNATLFSWPMFAQWFITGLMLMQLWRLLIWMKARIFRKSRVDSRAVAIVGTGELAQQVASHLKALSWGDYNIYGYFDDRLQIETNTPENRRTSARSGIACEAVGGFQQLIDLAESGHLDSVYIALPMRAESRIRELLDRLANSTAAVYVVPDMFVFELLHARSVNLNGLPAIGVIGEPMRGLDGWLKRVEDVILSSLILLMISPLLMFIASLVVLTSPGPAIFKQKRYGMDGKPIEVWKFRSMKVMENGKDFKQATRGDARITRVGAFLRKTSLDELPQFFNVLQGTMSIVGPRPHAIAHNEEFRTQIKSYMRRHKIKPGITGWAQINGWRGETDTLEKMQKRIEFDLHYIHNWSVWWDLQIIFQTVFKGFVGNNAY